MTPPILTSPIAEDMETILVRALRSLKLSVAIAQVAAQAGQGREATAAKALGAGLLTLGSAALLASSQQRGRG